MFVVYKTEPLEKREESESVAGICFVGLTSELYTTVVLKLFITRII